MSTKLCFILFFFFFLLAVLDQIQPSDLHFSNEANQSLHRSYIPIVQFLLAGVLQQWASRVTHTFFFRKKVPKCQISLERLPEQLCLHLQKFLSCIASRGLFIFQSLLCELVELTH